MNRHRVTGADSGKRSQQCKQETDKLELAFEEATSYNEEVGEYLRKGVAEVAISYKTYAS